MPISPRPVPTEKRIHPNSALGGMTSFLAIAPPPRITAKRCPARIDRFLWRRVFDPPGQVRPPLFIAFRTDPVRVTLRGAGLLKAGTFVQVPEPILPSESAAKS